jgi:hypothetical protein
MISGLTTESADEHGAQGCDTTPLPRRPFLFSFLSCDAQPCVTTHSMSVASDVASAADDQCLPHTPLDRSLKD